MKVVYILLVLIVAVSALGCIDNKQTQTSTKTPVFPDETKAPAQTSVPVPPSGSPASSSSDEFGIEAGLTEIDAMVNDSIMDISLSEAI